MLWLPISKVLYHTDEVSVSAEQNELSELQDDLSDSSDMETSTDESLISATSISDSSYNIERDTESDDDCSQMNHLHLDDENINYACDDDLNPQGLFP